MPSFAFAYHSGSGCLSNDSIVASYFAGACACAATHTIAAAQASAAKTKPLRCIVILRFR